MARPQLRHSADYWYDKLNGDIIHHVRERRNRAGISQRKLGDEAGVSYVHLNRLERGHVAWTTRMQARLYAALERLGA